MDALGNLVRFLLLPGQAHDMKGVAPLIKGVSFDALLADKAFDADWLLQDLDERGATAVIPLFSPGIWWIGFKMNRSGSEVQILQMYS